MAAKEEELELEVERASEHLSEQQQALLLAEHEQARLRGRQRHIVASLETVVVQSGRYALAQVFLDSSPLQNPLCTPPFLDYF